MEKKRRKREGGKLTMEGGKEFFFFVLFCFCLFLFLFSFLFVCLFLFSFLSCHFSKPLKYVLGLPKREFSTGKKDFTPGKKIRKNDFAPSENIPLTPLLLTYGSDFRTG